MSGRLNCPVELTGKTSSALYFTSTLVQEPAVQRARIFSGNTTWFVYNVEDYNQVDGVKLTILNSEQTRVNTDYDIKSIQGFDNSVLRIVLFDKKGNVGPTQNITEDTPSISRSPQSLLVSGGKWSFYSEEDYAGPIEINGQVNIGPGIYDFPTLPKSTKISDPDIEVDIDSTISSIPELEKVEGVIELTGGTETLVLEKSEGLIKRGFEIAKVSFAMPESVWIIYSIRDYGDQDAICFSSVVRYGNGSVEFGTNIRSAQGFNSTNPAAILFPRSQYRGQGFKVRETMMDLSPAHPEGVSSVLITGGLWKFYTEPYATGNVITVDGNSFLGPGDYNFSQDANFPVARAALFIITKEYSGGLFLGNGKDEVILQDDITVIQPGYTTASAGANSIWVVYDNVYFDQDESGSGGVVIEAEKVPTVEDREIRSAQGFTVKSPSFVLFPLPQNRGYGRVFDTSTPYLESVFESSGKHAMSSALVIGGMWSFFTGYNYTGTKIVIDGVSEFGPGTYNFADEQDENIISSVMNVGV